MVSYSQPIRDYLDAAGFKTHVSGKNVHTKGGGIAIRCVFPGCGDHSNHLNVFPDGNVKCWRCATRDSLAAVIKEIESCSWERAREIEERLLLESGVEVQRREPLIRPDSLKMPWEFTEDLPEPHRQYLQEERGFDPDVIRRDYGIMACHNVGRYRFRVIIPVFLGGRAVGFTSRDITGKATKRYDALPDEQWLVPPSTVVYNLDSVTGDVVAVVEGPTDVWRMGPGFVGMLTTEMTPGKAERLRRKGVRRVFTFTDPGAEGPAVKLETMLWWVDDLVHLRLEGEFEKGDPADLPEDTVRAVRREIFGSKGL